MSPSCCQLPETAIVPGAWDKQQMNSLCLPAPSTLTPALLPTSSVHSCNKEHWIKRDWQLQARETSKASHIKHLMMSPEGQPVPGAEMRAHMCLLHSCHATLAELWSVSRVFPDSLECLDIKHTPDAASLSISVLACLGQWPDSSECAPAELAEGGFCRSHSPLRWKEAPLSCKDGREIILKAQAALEIKKEDRSVL